MSDNIVYKEETVDKIINFLKEWQNGFFKKIYNGDPGPIPIEDMPCLVIEHLGTRINVEMTGLDTSVEMIDVAIVVNKRLDQTDRNTDAVEYKRQVRLLMQGVSPANSQYDTTTLLGIIRTNFTLGDYAIDQLIDIKYGDVPRNANSDELTSFEGHALCTISHHQQVPVRT